MAALAEATKAFLSVKQVAEYLNLNEKKVYALVNEGKIPGTKITGKWMFPRELVDRWMLESSHGGVLTDRLSLAGSDDPLLYRCIVQFAQDYEAHALISYTATGTRLGLDLLQSNRIDASCVHWGPSEESQMRHPALLSQYSQHRRWVLVHACRREQGLMISVRHKTTTEEPGDYLRLPLRWVTRQAGAGSQRFLRELLANTRVSPAQLDVVATAGSEREAASLIAMGEADVAPGARAAAREFGLEFVAVGWESFDIALRREIYFRRLFQELMRRLRSVKCAETAARLGGYELTDSGKLLFGDE